MTFIGRPRLAAEIRQHGLHLTDWHGADLRVAPADVCFETSPEAVRSADLVLVTVKSAGTEEVGRDLAQLLKPGAVVISFQNGIHNAEVLRAQNPGVTVITGMVEFNVISRGEGAFHHGTEGGLDVHGHPAMTPFLPAFAAAGLPLRQHGDMTGVMWAKLQLNLNNAINALAGIPLKEELSQRAFRRCIALAQQELLDLLDAAGIRPTRLKLPPRLIPSLLNVPDAVFRVLAGRMLAIDPLARSSMWEDLQAGRATEIDYLNGEVVKLAASLNRAAPANGRLVALILEAEQGGRRDWTGPELLKELQRASRA